MAKIRKNFTMATKRINAQGKRLFMIDSDSDSSDDEAEEVKKAGNPLKKTFERETSDSSEQSATLSGDVTDKDNKGDTPSVDSDESKESALQAKVSANRKRASTLIKTAGTQTQAVVRKSAVSVKKVTKNVIEGTSGTVQTVQTAFTTAASTTADFVQLNRKSPSKTRTRTKMTRTVVSYQMQQVSHQMAPQPLKYRLVFDGQILQNVSARR